MASKKSMESQCAQRAYEQVLAELKAERKDEGGVVAKYTGNGCRRLDMLYGRMTCLECKHSVWTSYECTLLYDFKKGRCIRKYGQQCAKCKSATFWRPLLDEDELMGRMKKQIRRALENAQGPPPARRPRPNHGGPHHRVDLCELCSGVKDEHGDSD